MRLPVIALALSLCLSVSAVAQKKVKPNTEEDADAAQQRTIAISLVSTLADEARSFKDQTRRARVQARAADVLWDSDPERARELFRRAWEAAESCASWQNEIANSARSFSKRSMKRRKRNARRQRLIND